MYSWICLPLWKQVKRNLQSTFTWWIAVKFLVLWHPWHVSSLTPWPLENELENLLISWVSVRTKYFVCTAFVQIPANQIAVSDVCVLIGEISNYLVDHDDGGMCDILKCTRCFWCSKNENMQSNNERICFQSGPVTAWFYIWTPKAFCRLRNCLFNADNIPNTFSWVDLKNERSQELCAPSRSLSFKCWKHDWCGNNHTSKHILLMIN